MQINTEYEFSCSAAGLFDFLADPYNEFRWNPQLQHVTLLTPGNTRQDSQWRLDYALMPNMRARIIRWEQPHQLDWLLESTNLLLVIRSTFIEHSADRCTVRTQADVTVRGALLAVSVIVLAVIQQDFHARGPKVAQAYAAGQSETTPS